MESNNATRKREASTASTATQLTLREAIKKLEARSDGVPRGWSGHYKKLLNDLRSVACSRGSQLIRGKPEEVISIDPFTATTGQMGPVLDGVIRKARARCSCTCQDCGRRGKHRQLGFERKVLCPACFVTHNLPRLARRTRSLTDTAKANGRTVILEAEMPELIRCLLPIDFWRTLQLQQPKKRPPAPMRYVHTADLAELSSRLKALENKCEKQIDDLA